MTTYVLPERYAWAKAHGYVRRPGVKIGGERLLQGVRFGDEDEVVIIGLLREEVRQQLHAARISSEMRPKMTYIAGEMPERYVPRPEDAALIESYRRQLARPRTTW